MTDGPIEIVSGPGGSPFVTDPLQPHLGGNFDGGDLGTQYGGTLWPWLVDRIRPENVLDLGCGTGESARWFRERRIPAIGLDGLGWNAVHCGKRNGVPCIVWDFRNGPLRIEGIDFIWCSDVAEHIDEEHLPHFLDTLSRCRVLAMCQGDEGNEATGWHHVTNKPQQWWVERLAAVGLVEDVEATRESRAIGNHGWWALTGRIYRRAT